MRKVPQFLFRCSLAALMPVAANAAGTYYTGNYQSPQSRYTQKNYTNYNQNSTYARNVGYTMPGAARSGNTVVGQSRTQVAQPRAPQQTAASSSSKKGFFVDAGLSHEVAQWQFEMKESGSILHYDNIGWNVFDVKGGYAFNVGNTNLQLDAGFKYGMQSGDSTMVDDDITNGGYFITQWVKDDADKTIIGEQIGHSLSVGSSSDGNMLGFNIGLGLTDFFKWGNVKFTPSIGYRYLKYKLETKNNYGLSVDTAACFRIDGSDEIQCDPAIIVNYGSGDQTWQQILWRDKLTDKLQVVDAADIKFIDTGGTYYYQQPGTSHSYEVEWTGPYIAMDMVYDINKNNAVNGRVELGFPGYSATGDQPYRFDWQHPKSVEDKADMFSAMHVGLGANWTTAITDMVSFSLGLTYDYYNVSGADAKTYLNEGYYTGIYNNLLSQWAEKYPTNTEQYMLGQMEGVAGDPVAINIKDLEVSCPGWVCSSNGEIESFYKSIGVRVGINAKF